MYQADQKAISWSQVIFWLEENMHKKVKDNAKPTSFFMKLFNQSSKLQLQEKIGNNHEHIVLVGKSSTATILRSELVKCEAISTRSQNVCCSCYSRASSTTSGWLFVFLEYFITKKSTKIWPGSDRHNGFYKSNSCSSNGFFSEITREYVAPTAVRPNVGISSYKVRTEAERPWFLYESNCWCRSCWSWQRF